MFSTKNLRPVPITIICLLVIFLFIVSGCKKSNNEENPPVTIPESFTPIPRKTPLLTTISAYVPFNTSGSGYVGINNYWINTLDKGAFSQEGTFDKFNNYVTTSYEFGSKRIGGLRSIPILKSLRNYIDIDGTEQLSLKPVSTGNGSGYFTLPGGGKISYPTNAFGLNYDDRNATLNVRIFTPGSPAFVISNPVVTVDMDEQRWYFRSYGAIGISVDPVLVNGKVTIEYPITAGLQANAPDSVEAWHNESLKWVKRGMAKKQGNVYVCTLTDIGDWCFGVREKGMYKIFQPRTAGGIPVINAIVRIKSDVTDINCARTDADGNAICFVPVNKSFTITIPPSWDSPNYPAPLVVSSAPFSISQYDPFEIKYAAGTKQLRSVKGKASKCDGTVVQSGVITVSDPNNGYTYCHIPVEHGKYSGAFVANQYNNNIYVLKLKDVSGQSGNDTAVKWEAGEEKEMNLSTCVGPTNLFMDYTLDGVSYSIKGDASDYGNPQLTYYPGGQDAMVSTGEGNNGVQFSFPNSYSSTGTYSPYFTGIWINKAYVGNSSGKLTITRYDLIKEGYVEGTFQINYSDGGGNHEVGGKFRLYRPI